MAGDSDGASSSSSASSEQGNLSPPDSPTSAGFNTDQLPSNTSQTTPTRTRMMPPSIPMSSRTSQRSRRGGGRRRGSFQRQLHGLMKLLTPSGRRYGPKVRWWLPGGVLGDVCVDLIFYSPFVMCTFLELVDTQNIGVQVQQWSGPRETSIFNLLSKGVEQDGWKFVLLAWFSPIPSYVINYALAATRVGFVVDFLLPTVIGCLPMILQNTSIGCLAGAAVASASGAKKSQVWSYLFPLGILSSILISLRVKKYATDILVSVTCPKDGY
ncbi:SNARE associated Golgi protein family [Actinidia rufa]|uniref:SNARE associated Golgi protein family n=1 Tax=Actinidia rufa TaxID=165716 RepID=A0A7J0FMG1_9ERIC|nr:SNARE associated Golgi protein family [Actinidia rufa]